MILKKVPNSMSKATEGLHGATTHLFQLGSLLWRKFNTPRTIRCSWVVRIFPKWPLLLVVHGWKPPTHVYLHWCITPEHLENPSILSVPIIFHISQTWESHFSSQTLKGYEIWHIVANVEKANMASWHWHFWTSKQNRTSRKHHLHLKT